MTETANLGLPFIDGSQAQKHVTHNEALRILDDAIQIAVLDTTLTAPPPSPVDGERHIVATGATGAWAGQGNAVATWETNAWRFLAPKAGWCVWSIADDALLVFDGSTWTPVTTASATLDNAPHVAINTTVAGSNLLTVRSNDALLNAIETADGGTGDVRLQLSKEAAVNTSSVVFSDAFSGRAEFGLTGDDDFHLKVSADGTAWRDALKFDRATGRVSFPSGGAREMLSADRAYYVRTDGSDSNNGLSNSSGGAFLTIQKAINTVAALDINIYNVTINVADGTYTGANTVLGPWLGSGSVTVVGNTATPGNVIINPLSGGCFTATGGGFLVVSGMELRGQFGLVSQRGSRIYGTASLRFGAASAYHVYANGGSIIFFNNYSISGGAAVHVNADSGGAISAAGLTVTLTGTPAFSAAYAAAGGAGSSIIYYSNTFSGSATGARYSVNNGAFISVNGAGISYLPGNAAGSGTNFGAAPWGLYS
jgi:hypothetical protein